MSAPYELVPYSEYTEYPLLTQAEFDLACHHFHNRYIQATLGPLRRTFRIDLRHDMANDSTYITIIQPIRQPVDDVSDLLNFGALRASDAGVQTETDDMMHMDIEAEEGDAEAYHQPTPDLYEAPHAIYEIHLHPVYRVPTLWFQLRNLPDANPFDLDLVYRYLVPDFLKAQLRNVGVMGGVSAAHHPLTGVPCFFIHPCNTQEAMRPFQASLRDYMMVWIGIVGMYVGLDMPLGMAHHMS